MVDQYLAFDGYPPLSSSGALRSLLSQSWVNIHWMFKIRVQCCVRSRLHCRELKAELKAELNVKPSLKTSDSYGKCALFLRFGLHFSNQKWSHHSWVLLVEVIAVIAMLAYRERYPQLDEAFSLRHSASRSIDKRALSMPINLIQWSCKTFAIAAYKATSHWPLAA